MKTTSNNLFGLSLTFVLCVYVGLSPVNLRAQNFWSFSNGPYGGTSANGLLFSPSGVLFASSGIDIFSSSDKGSTWKPVLSLKYPQAVYSFAMNSKGHLFVGNAAHMINFSNDEGANWTALPMPGTTFTNALFLSNDVLYASNGSSIYTSKDEGSTWSTYAETSTLDNVVGFAQFGTGVAAVVSELGFPGTSHLLYTANEGTSWDSISPAFPQYMNSVASDGTTLYAASDSSVFRFDDVQKSFIRLQLPHGLIGSLQVIKDGKIFVDYRISNAVPDSFVYSTDMGQTFRPFGPGGEKVLSVIESIDGYFLGATNDGVFHSTDNGMTWTTGQYGLPSTVENIVADQGQVLLATASHVGGVISQDNGATWQPMGGVARNLYSLIHSTTGNVFSYPNIEIKNNGASVVQLPFTFQYADQNGALYNWDGTMSDTAFVRSTDEGQHWSTILIPRNLSYPTLKFATKNNTFFLQSISKIGGKQVNPLYRSIDGGQNWQDITSSAPTIAPDDTVNITPFAEGANGVVFGIGQHTHSQVSAQSIYRSSDHGVTWTETPTRIHQGYFNKIVTEGDTVYAVSNKSDSAILRSMDNGLTWSVLTSGLPGGGVNDITAQPDGSVFAATNFGVYRHPELQRGITTGPIVNDLISVSLYPNPTTANSTVKLSVAKRTPIRITLFDVLGSVVATPFEGMVERGDHSFGFDLSSRPTGIYFCKISSGPAQKVVSICKR